NQTAMPSPTMEPAPSNGRSRFGGSSWLQPNQTQHISPYHATVKSWSRTNSVSMLPTPPRRRGSLPDDRGERGPGLAQVLVQLGEDRCRLGERSPDLDRGGPPPCLLHPVVPHQHRVLPAAVLGDGVDLRLRGPHPVTAARLEHLLRPVRQERGQQGVAVLHQLQRTVQHGVTAGRVVLQL